ncbi:MAG: DUF1569 domain-containing protein [Acidobacteriaceae bacterium]
MKNLFDPTLIDDTKHRILHLRPDSQPQWGTMAVSPTLAHLTSSIDMALGTLHVARAPFPGRLIGPLIKPLVFRDDKPMRRNSPSSPALFSPPSTTFDFPTERAKLITALDTFATEGPTRCHRPHPFFGPLNPQQWAILMYKHLDHHLRQFSA